MKALLLVISLLTLPAFGQEKPSAEEVEGLFQLMCQPNGEAAKQQLADPGVTEEERARLSFFRSMFYNFGASPEAVAKNMRSFALFSVEGRKAASEQQLNREHTVFQVMCAVPGAIAPVQAGRACVNLDGQAVNLQELAGHCTAFWAFLEAYPFEGKK